MFALSAGNCGDAPEGRTLLRRLGPIDRSVYLLMDRAYEGDETRALAEELGYNIPIVPPKSNRKNPWSYDKLDIIFLTFVYLALIVDTLM